MKDHTPGSSREEAKRVDKAAAKTELLTLKRE